VNVPNGWDNIILTDLTHGNVIGGLNAPNFVNVAGGSGINVSAGAHENQILKNYLSGNSKYGVLFDGANTASNVISRTIIQYNGVLCPGCDGIGERNGAGPNRWTEIGTRSNAGLGIDRFTNSDATNIVDAPYLYITGVNSGTGVVTGIANGTGILVLTKVELYRVAVDPSGYGEGYSFVGSALTDGAGNWSITDPSIATYGPCYTAFATEVVVVFTGSTEFSRTNCSLFLPLIRR
jgi:hypothetical protein